MLYIKKIKYFKFENIFIIKYLNDYIVIYIFNIINTIKSKFIILYLNQK